MNAGQISHARRLTLAASTYARVALRTAPEKQDLTHNLTAAIAAGTAVELAVKAAVASTLPGLLALQGDAHSQLFLAGKSGLPNQGHSDVRTITAKTAHILLEKILPSYAPIAGDFKAVTDVRNTAAHLGIVDETELAAGIQAMTKCVNRILPALSWTHREFWGFELEKLATIYVTKANEEQMIRFQKARTFAEQELEKLKLQFGAKGFQAVAEMVQNNSGDGEEEYDDCDKPYECPVCKYDGWLSGVVERGEPQYDDAVPYEAWAERTFISTKFVCRVCHFNITQPDLEIAGLPTKECLETDSDPWEFREMMEEGMREEYRGFERDRYL